MTMNITSHGEKIATLNPTISGDAPDFELTDLKGNKIKLSKLEKPVLISVFLILILEFVHFKPNILILKQQNILKLTF